MTVDQSKIDALREAMFSEVYVPAFVEAFNTKAASAGIRPISSQDDLGMALDLVPVAEAAITGDPSDPLRGAHAKVAAAMAPSQVKAAAVNMVKNAGSNPRILAAIKGIVSGATAKE